MRLLYQAHSVLRHRFVVVGTKYWLYLSNNTVSVVQQPLPLVAALMIRQSNLAQALVDSVR